MPRNNQHAQKNIEAGQPESNTLLLAILTLLVDERERETKKNPDMNKTEFLLDAVGISHAQIGLMLSKNPAAIRMAVTRAKARGGKKVEEIGEK